VARRIPAVAALAVVGLAAAGCASLFHKPRPDLELSVDERPWRVRCGWALPPSPDPAAAPGTAASGEVFASDVALRRLVLEGRLEDGFLRVDGVRAASDQDDRDVGPLPPGARTARETCLGALARIELPPEVAERPRLYAVTGVRDGEGVEVPLVFPGDPLRPRPASRLVAFGDSLSDTGNLKGRLLVFPASPYWLGRFSNGPNWTDHLAERTGLAIQNHAYGGAVAVPHEDVPSESVVTAIQQGAQLFLTGSLDRQVKDYVERDLPRGAVEAPDETVYVIWGGANDYISKEPFTGDIGTLLDAPEGEAGYVRIVDEAVEALAGQVRRLHAAGGRQFALVNLPDLGRTPIVVHNESYEPRVPTSSDAGRRMLLARKLGELTRYHNERLAGALEGLAAELPEATLVAVDADRAIDFMLAGRAPDGSGRPFDYGFALRDREQVLRDGGHAERLQDRCYAGGYLGTRDPARVCPASRRAMFWDVVHPTSYTHCWIAFFVQWELARAGLVAAPDPEAHRAYCAERSALAS
jgi:phospholipase/lecithinase/hemolysin